MLGIPYEEFLQQMNIDVSKEEHENVNDSILTTEMIDSINLNNNKLPVSNNQANSPLLNTSLVEKTIDYCDSPVSKFNSSGKIKNHTIRYDKPILDISLNDNIDLDAMYQNMAEEATDTLLLQALWSIQTNMQPKNDEDDNVMEKTDFLNSFNKPRQSPFNQIRSSIDQKAINLRQFNFNAPSISNLPISTNVSYDSGILLSSADFNVLSQNTKLSIPSIEKDLVIINNDSISDGMFHLQPDKYNYQNEFANSVKDLGQIPIAIDELKNNLNEIDEEYELIFEPYIEDEGLLIVLINIFYPYIFIESC